MKNWKKAMALLLATVSMFSTLAGCGKEAFIASEDEDTQKEVDINMSQLHVGSYAGGYGREWLDAAIARFEKQYENHSFETGKKGVQVHVDYQKSYSGLAQASMDSLAQSVIFGELIYFNEYIINGKFLDISSILTSSLSDVSGGKETGTIEDKLTESQQKAYKAYDGKYYCLPYYESFGGLSINVDLFNEYNLYVSDQTVGSTYDEYGCIVDEFGMKSKGPDGVVGTMDDGLPATYDEFFKVCDKMVSLGIDPFIWAGGFPEYFNLLATALYADGAGAEAFSTTYDFDSNGETVEIYDKNMQKQKVVITPENAYLMKQQVAKHDAIEFANRIASTPAYVSQYALSGACTHEDAQAYFVEGKSKIGFIIEGNYWYNEAKPVFEEMVQDKGDEAYSADNRNFQWIPMPKATATAAQDYEITTLDRNYSCAFINANVKGDAVKEELSKLFLKFCYTKESLIEYTVISGTTKGVDYQLTEAEEADMMSKLNTFEKSVWDFRSRANVLYPISDSPILINNQKSFNLVYGDWQLTVGGAKHVTPYNAIKANVSPVDYFKAGWIDEATWLSDYSKYL